MVAGDKYTYIYQNTSTLTIVDQLLTKLHAEVERTELFRHTIEQLQRFYAKKRVADGITDLEAKLNAADRCYELLDAFERKEMFAKLLERWSLYASAQEILAYLLARVEYEFSYFVVPQLAILDHVGINQVVHERVVIPTVSDCGSSVFAMNHDVVMDMIYWLAEQCYVRWHQ
jgi:hypothetical protein